MAKTVKIQDGPHTHYKFFFKLCLIWHKFNDQYSLNIDFHEILKFHLVWPHIRFQTCHFNLTQNLNECEKKSEYTEKNLNLTTK